MTDKRPAVFLDRDGTINLDAGYIDRLERFELYPFAIDAIRLFKQAGYLVVVLTNQAGVAHGMYGEDFVATLAEYLAERARLGGAQIDGHYYCPHSPDAAVPKYRVECECRKPKPGMARRAAEELGIDLGAVGRHRRPVARHRRGQGRRLPRHPREDRLRRHRGAEAAAGTVRRRGLRRSHRRRRLAARSSGALTPWPT